MGDPAFDLANFAVNNGLDDDRRPRAARGLRRRRPRRPRPDALHVGLPRGDVGRRPAGDLDSSTSTSPATRRSTSSGSSEPRPSRASARRSAGGEMLARCSARGHRRDGRLGRGLDDTGAAARRQVRPDRRPETPGRRLRHRRRAFPTRSRRRRSRASPDVSLYDSSGKLVKAAPTGADLFAAASSDYLDLPGDPLHPGCSYEEWAKQISAGKPTTSYAHIVTEPGKLALQYWFYYPFNDFNNKHESDWEMIQLMFDASTVADALKKDPATVGYSQHSGAERAAWGDSKLEKRGPHPIVYPGKGSHANYFSPSVWLGHGPEVRASAATTPAGPPISSRPTPCCCRPRRRPRLRARSRGSPIRANGARRRRGPTTARPVRT